MSTDYDVDPTSGLICSPGKFEGEPAYAPHFWNLALEGSGEEIWPPVAGDESVASWRVPISPEDRAQFPQLPPSAAFVELWESEYGFVFSDLLSEDGEFL